MEQDQSLTNGGALVFSSSSFSQESFAALAWLLDQIIIAVQQTQAAGGGIKTRRRVKGMHPVQYAPVDPVEEDEALLLAGVL